MDIEQYDDTPNARNYDPDTSHEAGRSVNRAFSQDYVRQTLGVFGPFADHELVEFHSVDTVGLKRFGRFSPQRLRSARAELVEAGEVEMVDGVFRLTDSGRRAHVWRVVPKQVTYEEKAEVLTRAGIILHTPVGSFMDPKPLERLMGGEVARDEHGKAKPTAEQAARGKAAVDKIAAEIGSRDLIDIYYYLHTQV